MVRQPVDVVVSGAGIIGVSTAYRAAREGMSVVVCDRRSASGLETSFANGGWNFNLALGWLDTRVTRDAVAARTGRVASIKVVRNLANAPKFAANFGVKKEFDIGGDTRLKPNVNDSDT